MLTMLSTVIGSAGKMAVVLSRSHTYNNPVASDHARQLMGDVMGPVNLGDTIYHGRQERQDYLTY